MHAPTHTYAQILCLLSASHHATRTRFHVLLAYNPRQANFAHASAPSLWRMYENLQTES